MPAMTPFEAAFCRSAPWRLFARRLVLPWALQGAAPTGRVLEIGAGSGAMAGELLAMYPNITMSVTDFDDGMVAAARERLAGFADRVECRQADATALPFEDDSFDTVLSWIMLHHTIEWEKALAEAARVLRPGGRVIGYDLLSRGAFEFLHKRERSYHRMIRPHELQPVLGALALTDVEVRVSRGGFVARFRATASATVPAEGR